ncbi:MAG: phenylalanine--tRNA ligase subunit beta, partial [Gemmatimonadetes bacterium]|nr:B3/4 domain-containing protein [Gemmatimonadota bacterium]NIT66946.1 B3/4 domain-containing protein [Gemmatimonadota bacterium]NIV23598.1 phenylalanine--tRNA ligase subunit beta [Gemmatimonadota bacterium]NIW77656.1 phenylalanine--tRNA ligase subunit beta [Gemmatimonadota bacterium]NIY35523.1 phenylalanine--tRNA ligase subunit beta [Gemmatimonadota bacterium]
VIRGVSVGPSPEWLANRLRAIGQQPINNVVDATNYVLHELNQPLHAFDLATLGGPAVVIRRARTGETLRTLDGKDRALDPEM